MKRREVRRCRGCGAGRIEDFAPGERIVVALLRLRSRDDVLGCETLTRAVFGEARAEAGRHAFEDLFAAMRHALARPICFGPPPATHMTADEELLVDFIGQCGAGDWVNALGSAIAFARPEAFARLADAASAFARTLAPDHAPSDGSAAFRPPLH